MWVLENVFENNFRRAMTWSVQWTKPPLMRSLTKKTLKTRKLGEQLFDKKLFWYYFAQECSERWNSDQCRIWCVSAENKELLFFQQRNYHNFNLINFMCLGDGSVINRWQKYSIIGHIDWAHLKLQWTICQGIKKSTYWFQPLSSSD